MEIPSRQYTLRSNPPERVRTERWMLGNASTPLRQHVAAGDKHIQWVQVMVPTKTLHNLHFTTEMKWKWKDFFMYIFPTYHIRSGLKSPEFGHNSGSFGGFVFSFFKDL